MTKRLNDDGAPLLAAYCEWVPEKDRWIFYLVPKGAAEERDLVDKASGIMIERPYRSAFSLSDVFVDAHQIERARALAAYLRSSEDIDRQFDTTFTGGHYFDSVIVMYVARELQKQDFAAYPT